MQEASSLPDRWRGVILVLPFLLIAVSDQLTKIFWIGSYGEGEVICQLGFFRLIHVQNTGAIWGLFQGQSSVLAIIAAIEVFVLLVLGYFVYRSFPYLAGRLKK